MAGRSRAARTRRFVRGGVGVLALLALGEIVGRSGLVDPDDVPPTSRVLTELGRLLADGAFRTDILYTLRTWLGGLLIATVLAVPAGALLGSVPGLNHASRALVELLRPIPSVAVIPLIALVVGVGAELRLVVVAYACTWPILFNTIYGLMEVDPLARETARGFGFGRLAVLTRVSLASAAPFILTGIRISAGIGLIAEVSAEIIVGGDAGIGTAVTLAQSAAGQLDVVLAAIAVAGLLGYTANLLLETAGRRAFGWAAAEETA
jgi:NitT/TauT family transport system permease protein